MNIEFILVTSKQCPACNYLAKPDPISKTSILSSIVNECKNKNIKFVNIELENTSGILEESERNLYKDYMFLFSRSEDILDGLPFFMMLSGKGKKSIQQAIENRTSVKDSLSGKKLKTIYRCKDDTFEREPNSPLTETSILSWINLSINILNSTDRVSAKPRAGIFTINSRIF